MAVNKYVYYYMYNPSSITKEKKYEINRICKRINSQLVVLKSNVTLRKEFAEQEGVMITIDRTVLYPTFTAFCFMILFSQLPYKIAKGYQREYEKSDLYPFHFSERSAFRHKLMFKIMNSSLLFDLYYMLGFKYLYSSYKHKHE